MLDQILNQQAQTSVANGGAAVARAGDGIAETAETIRTGWRKAENLVFWGALGAAALYCIFRVVEIRAIARLGRTQ